MTDLVILRSGATRDLDAVQRIVGAGGTATEFGVEILRWRSG
jgi:hypothetical protein